MKKIHLFAIAAMVCLTALACARAFAAPADPPAFKVSFIPKPWEVNVERKYIALADGWRFMKTALPGKALTYSAENNPVDPKKYVLRDGTTKPLGTRCAEPTAASCDDTSWITVSVPHNWFDLGPEMDRFTGTVWYRKTFDVTPELAKKNASVVFWASYYKTEVYLNGEKLGNHEGGYTGFKFDVTGRLHAGSNLLAVKVDNLIAPGDIPIGDWWNYGGLHREVFVEFTDSARIDRLKIDAGLADDYSNGDAAFTVSTTGAEGKKLRVFVYRLDGEKLTPAAAPAEAAISGAETALRISISKPDLWSPENPALYFAKAVIYDGDRAADGSFDFFGFRRFEVRGEKLYLNGKRIFMRGVNRHDEMAHGEFPDAGRAMTEEERINDFKLIKEMGANAMRTGHYPNHLYNYFINDRLGILTIEEFGPVRTDLSGDEIINKLKVQATETILRDYNHPSIVMWSIGNEFGGDSCVKMLKRLSETARSLDKRPLMFTETGGAIVLAGYKHVDIAARNEYVGWYEGTNNNPHMTPVELKTAMEKILPLKIETWHKQTLGKPFLVMETGAESVIGTHTADPSTMLDRGTEEYQATVLRNQYELLKQQPNVAGMFVWVFADFKTKSAGGTCQYTKHLNRKGLVSFNREKKAAFFEIQKIYKEIAEEYKNKE